jgi:ABC-type nitrate/sulfonate/bicarbonate transport system substrate-binding protein
MKQGKPTPAEKAHIRVGYVRLTDSAPLILAQERGFYAAQGLEVELVREVSWANLRDRLVLGDLDAAQLLSPLPMLTTWGAGGVRAQLLTGLVLSLNGNAITVSTSLWSEIGVLGANGQPDALAASQRLKRRLLTSNIVPTFATVHLFSMHTLQLRLWLQAGGIDPDQDVKIIVLPPEQMSDSLARGLIDGYCVGEPWSTQAVQQGIGGIVATGYQIWNNAPEKVLAVTGVWHQHHPATHLRLRLALMQACASLADPATLREMATILSRPGYLDLPEQLLLPSLSGMLRFWKQQEPVRVEDFHVFSRYQTGFPWRSTAELITRHCSFALGRDIKPEECVALAQQCYRPDLYREAARWLDLPSPDRDSKTENSHEHPWEAGPGILLGPDLALHPL